MEGFKLALTPAAAELAFEKRVERLLKGKDEDAIAAVVDEKWAKLQQVGRRMLDASAEVGVALEALRRRSPHGTFESRVAALGISKKTSHRLRQLAHIREALPKNPPAALGISVWTDSAALEFGETLTTMQNDLGDDAKGGVDADEVANKVKERRRTASTTNLAGRVMRLHSDIAQALASGGFGAEEAVEQMRVAARALKAIMNERDTIDVDDE